MTLLYYTNESSLGSRFCIKKNLFNNHFYTLFLFYGWQLEIILNILLLFNIVNAANFGYIEIIRGRHL